MFEKQEQNQNQNQNQNQAPILRSLLTWRKLRQ